MNSPLQRNPLESAPPRWSIAVMCYNEKDALKPMVERTLAVMRPLGDSFEILIVNDGSKDGSKVIADQLAAANPEVRVFHHPTNYGIGQVLIDGYGQTKGESVVILPADLQFAPEDLPAAMKELEGADVVNITREHRHDPFMRKMISSFDQNLVWLLFGLRAGDLHWVKLYRRHVLSAITIQSRTPLVDTELLVKAHRNKARIKEVILPHHPRLTGQSTGGRPMLLIKTFIDLIKLRFTLKM